MKKMLFIPFLIPMFGVISCNNNDYYVSDSKIENVLSFENVEYAQFTVLKIDDYETHKFKEFSPNIYHSISNLDGYTEEYVIKHDDGTYTKFERSSEEAAWGDEKPAKPEEFDVPKDLGTDFVERYRALKAKTPREFNKKKKCYTFTVKEEETECTDEFYFYKNKLVRYYLETISGSKKSYCDINIAYDQTPLTPPKYKK